MIFFDSRYIVVNSSGYMDLSFIVMKSGVLNCVLFLIFRINLLL